MDETIYKIAMAGYLHDIGKFAERAHGHRSESETVDTGFYPDDKFINDNMGLYQPNYQGNYTHKHAVYTAAFIYQIEKLLPKKFNKGEWGLEDSFMNLAAGHHNPKTPMQWIIAMADRVSSGFDRDEFEDYNNETGIGFRDYKKTRLLTIFEGISTDGKWKDDNLEAYNYRYPLKELSPQNIFPANDEQLRLIDDKQASKDYSDLFFNFVNSLDHLEHKQNIPLWFEHFDSLFMIYASHIPAATVGKVIPDVSLYDHCKLTSAMASALYVYHKETNTLEVDIIKDYAPNKFLIINSDFYGIQDFIFTESGNTGKASAKLLRGRSFYVSLLTELAADMLCRKIGLPSSSVILNAAGKFTILAPNTERVIIAINEIEDSVNKWLIKHFYGQASMGISFIPASCDDFVSKNFPSLWERLSREIDKKKFSKFNLNEHSGSVKDYLDSYDNKLGICPFCVKRPADENAKIKEDHACRICRDHEYIGSNLVKKNRLAITAIDADLHGQKLLLPIFDNYQMSFVTGRLVELSKAEALFKFWDIGIAENGNIAKDITAKFINGYVPKYGEDDKKEEMIERLLHGNKTDEKKNELFDMIDDESPKTFLHIAKMALNKIQDSKSRKKFMGIEALGILKADVDNLGLVFACGLKENRQTLSRLATLSRQMNNYFSIFLPYMLKTIFKDIYTVFAGGDDLFLIGPWNRIIELAGVLNETFIKYVCCNSDITISAGISVHKPGVPVVTIAEHAEHALELSKTNNKKRITVFGETATWDNFNKLEEIKRTIQKWLDDKKINNAMLFRFNEFQQMAKLEKEIRDLKFHLQLEDMECLKWHSRFKYTVVRNIGKDLKGDHRTKAIETVSQSVKWFYDYHGAFKMPLWQIIYNRR